MGSKKSVRKHRTENRTFTILIEQGEDGFCVANVPSLRSCYTQARTLEELSPRIREVVALCLEEEEPVPMKFIGVQRLQLSI